MDQAKALASLLDTYRKAAQTQREKGNYFEALVVAYLRNEPRFADLYEKVWTFSEWAAEQGRGRQDVGIDLVARTRGTGQIHAIQCKLYAEDHRVTKADIDSFFTASGQRPFEHRVIVTTSRNWTQHAEDALTEQHIPVTRIDLTDLETSLIDWSRFSPSEPAPFRPRKEPRPHQVNAFNDVVAGLSTADRGKMIMACGTGKTFASLKIAEAMVGAGGIVLFLAPSLSLVSQTLHEWTQDALLPLHSFAVCSDSETGKRKHTDPDTDRVQVLVHELRYPATTSPERLAQELTKRHDAGHMSVIFATYHSIDVIHKAQREHRLPAIDLVICDEAHRTTGSTYADEDDSHFVKVHDNDYLKAAKRLYMTATPRIFGDQVKNTAKEGQVALYSMDDRSLFGSTLHTLTFSEAVKRGLLVDYKVIVLAIEESHVSRRIQALLSDEDNQLRVDDASKIIGCWKALSKQGLTADEFDDDTPMRRAVAFCQVIQETGRSKTRKVASKTIAAMFQQVVESYQDTATDEDESAVRLACEARHIDGSMSATEKSRHLDWLKEPSPEDTCRVLSNVRCLSEGVDVPSLDAVLFLTPRNSQVDVVQSVGRVMRLAPGKKRGYIVLPVVIPAGMEPSEALHDNKTYRVVWQVLQALRSHDDRFNASINKMDMTGPDPRRMEVIAVVDKAARRASTKKDGLAKKARGQRTIGKQAPKQSEPEQQTLEFQIGEIERAIYAKVVEKVGNRLHWEDWAKDIAHIAAIHIDRIRGILGLPPATAADAGAAVSPDPTDPAKTAFLAFGRQLRADLNDAITDAEIIEMLAQHLITRPVFDALFDQYSFASSNPMSQSMQSVLDVFDQHHLNKEATSLEGFYESVRMRVEGIKDDQSKQRIVVELYDRFFRNAFPKMAERLGIVYTPVEVVDFILNSVSDVLGKEFGQTLGSRNVHIIDPFTGTGTFVSRLIQSGLIQPQELEHKYRHEIHANEIVLLAYYIAAINIEAAYHGVMGGHYVPFSGICLADTFQMYEDQDLVEALVPDNSKRRQRQRELDIRVIVGNPPYSIGQGSANDINANLAYPSLDDRISSTYVSRSNATLSRGLYDSYIRAIRWASDRIGNAGVIGFVTNAGFLESGSADGLRKSLAEEFSSIYVFHLRGNARTSGEARRKERDNIFGMGSRAPIAISILVKNPEAAEHGRILFKDIGDYLTLEEKLTKIAGYASLAGIPDWTPIVPDSHGDWLNQRNDRFTNFMSMGDKRGGGPVLFLNFSMGVGTNRDAWTVNSDRQQVIANMTRMIQSYNDHADRFENIHAGTDLATKRSSVDTFIDTDPTLISWSRGLKQDLARGRRLKYDHSRILMSMYRPFTRQWLYFDRGVNEMVNLIPRLFPEPDSRNTVIMVNVNWKGDGNLALMANTPPDLHANGDAQCFPLYLYDDGTSSNPDTELFANDGPQRRDAITAEGLSHFQAAYPELTLTREDVFYYTYAILHSPDYLQRYGDNLSKELPRIPRVRKAEHFKHFADAGRRLADLHLHFDTDQVPMNRDAKVVTKGDAKLSDKDYRVEKMRLNRVRDPETRKLVTDRSTVIYNDRISITNIPERAWGYVVNGKPALDWVMERQAVRTDKASGIVNDANAWAVETMGNPKYPLELFLRVITVSLETQDIVDALPALDLLDAS